MDAADTKQSRFKVTVQGVQNWSTGLNALEQRYPGWRLAQSTEAVYCLPQVAIDRLAGHAVGNRAFLDASSAAAERDFTVLCQAHHMVGMRDRLPVSYLLLAPLPRPNATSLNTAGFDGVIVDQLVDTTEEFNLRLRAVVGWLLTEPRFLGELEQLRREWDARPHGPRMRLFPLARVPEVFITAGDDPEFLRILSAFLDRWELASLVTWDLPQPQGPLLPSPLPPDAPALPRTGLAVHLPTHFQVQQKDDLHDRISRLQQSTAEERGLERSFASVSHHDAYGHMLEIIHLERSIRARFSACAPRRGLVTAIEAACAAHLGASLDLVQKYRKGIQRCKRGQRDSIAWLRPRAR